MMEIGRVKGHRGTDGEMTVLIHDGAAADWETLGRVFIARGDGAPQPFSVASSRGYRNRLVLRLAGIDDGNAAAQMRGARVLVPLEEAPPTAENEWYDAELEGMAVQDEHGHPIGVVRAIVKTAGTDLLAVTGTGTHREASTDDDILIPLARTIVLQIDAASRSIVVRPPEGLLDLNRGGGKPDEGAS